MQNMLEPSCQRSSSEEREDSDSLGLFPRFYPNHHLLSVSHIIMRARLDLDLYRLSAFNDNLIKSESAARTEGETHSVKAENFS